MPGRPSAPTQISNNVLPVQQLTAVDVRPSDLYTLMNNKRQWLQWLATHRLIRNSDSVYPAANGCFRAAKRVTVVEADDGDLEETFGVSQLQVKEEKITRDISSANALIFLGENDQAREILLNCLQDMQNEYSDHPELANGLNSVGITEERGHADLSKAMKWYVESYRVRKKLAKLNQAMLVVSLNNIGTIYLRLGQFGECKKYLDEALSIRRDLGWVHNHTSLTLIHLGILNFRRGDFAQALTDNLEAERILQEIAKDEDTHLRIFNTLGHLVQLLKVKHEQVIPENSADYYFEESANLASKVARNLSDDGYHHLLLAHEHVMLQALGSSEEKYEKHKNTILPYFQVCQGVGKKVYAVNMKIPDHMDLYRYFSTTDYQDIDKRIFVGHLVRACEFVEFLVPTAL